MILYLIEINIEVIFLAIQIFLYFHMHVWVPSLFSHVQLWPMDCSLQGSPVHGILQVRILEWAAMPSLKGSSWPRDWTHVSVFFIGSWVLYHWHHLGSSIFSHNPYNIPLTESNQVQLLLVYSEGVWDKKEWVDLFKGFPGGAKGEEPACQCRRPKRHRFNSWVRRSPGGGHGNPLQYSFLENPHRQRSLANYSSWGCKESDTTEAT